MRIKYFGLLFSSGEVEKTLEKIEQVP